MLVIAVTVIVAGMPVAMADQQVPPGLEKALSEKFPDISIDSVNPSVLPGLYEVVTPSEIVYVDAKGEHLVIGQIVETASNRNLTETRWNELNKIYFSSLPFEQAIKIVKGDGSRKLAVFADPFCPYCQEFEQTLTEVDNVTLYVFLYPLENLHPGATEAAKEIWCADDRAAAWTAWMVSKKAPDIKTCESTAVEALKKLGDELRINSTPTLFFADGSRVPGAITADRLEKLFSDLQGSKR